MPDAPHNPPGLSADAAAEGGQAQTAIGLHYFLRIPNVGDLINPSVVAAVSGCPTAWTANRARPHLLAIGSVMASATAASLIWGSGVMHASAKAVGGALPGNVFAVRGQLSRQALRAAGMAVGDVPLGDPGYLAPTLLGVMRQPVPRHKVGVVAHYVDRQNPLFRRLLAAPGVADLNVHDDPRRFIEQMADCAAVLSSSLHGLIFAEALGLPNLWVTVGGDIGGGRFKYDDWFSTTRRPQQNPHEIGARDNVHHLARIAEVRESSIDVDALKAAFPRQRLAETSVATQRPMLPAEECRRRPVPAFIISYNRGAYLERVIAAIRRLRRPVEIVIHDNGSSDPHTLDVLRELEGNGVRVFHRMPIGAADELSNVDETVAAFFADWAEPSRYIVSDDDIDIGEADGAALDVYDELLNLFRKVDSVGPMLRIRDVPPTYPLYARAMNRHIQQFWSQRPQLVATPHGQAAVIEAPIDTTFALHRAGERFRRLKPSLRVYEPYEARHLDWYIAADQADAYTATSSPRVSHWNNREQISAHAEEPIAHERYFAVRRKRSGDLEIYERRVEPARTTGSPDEPRNHQRARRVALGDEPPSRK